MFTIDTDTQTVTCLRCRDSDKFDLAVDLADEICFYNRKCDIGGYL